MWNQKLAFALIFISLSSKEAMRALKIADEEKDKVISTISHELRTPINGILGLLDLIEKEIISQEGKEYLSNCLSCTKLLQHFVDSIIDLASIRK